MLAGYHLTDYAMTWFVEYWAEAVGIWAFEDPSGPNQYPGLVADFDTKSYKDVVFAWVIRNLNP